MQRGPALVLAVGQDETCSGEEHVEPERVSGLLVGLDESKRRSERRRILGAVLMAGVEPCPPLVERDHLRGAHGSTSLSPTVIVEAERPFAWRMS
jgi:hypothetical protein